MNYFVYNGVSSLDMGLRIESKNVFSAPEYDVTFQSIPGRNGDLILPNGRYPNAQVTYSVFLPAKSIAELAEKITKVKAWLYGEQNAYHSLSDSYDTLYTRKAVYSGSLDIEDQLNRIGVFTVSFSCHPFRYSVAGTDPITLTQSGSTVTNPESFESLPILTLTGEGTVTLTIQGGGQNKSWVFTGLDGSIVCDSEQMNFYSGTTPMNDKVSGDGFPRLQPGVNTISWVGTVTSLVVQPRWVTL